ncbi:hypothetical protein [Arsenicicoccus piscis]|nr:hypothetical protein [Arsenicicoccus piscis]
MNRPDPHVHRPGAHAHRPDVHTLDPTWTSRSTWTGGSPTC